MALGQSLMDLAPILKCAMSVGKKFVAVALFYYLLLLLFVPFYSMLGKFIFSCYFSAQHLTKEWRKLLSVIYASKDEKRGMVECSHPMEDDDCDPLGTGFVDYWIQLTQDLEQYFMHLSLALISCIKSFRITHIFKYFQALRRQFREPRKHDLRPVIQKIIVYILLYILQYDLFGSRHTYAYITSPIRYIFYPFRKLLNVLNYWIGILLVLSTLVILYYAISPTIVFIAKHVSFSIGLIMYIDWLLAYIVFGTTLISRRLLLVIVDLFMGPGYVPYLGNFWFQLKKTIKRRIAVFLEVASSDNNFYVYFHASLLFLTIGAFKLSIEIIDFALNEWFPCVLYPSATIKHIWPVSFIKKLSMMASIAGFCHLGLLFMVWDRQVNATLPSLIVLTLFVLPILGFIAWFAVKPSGPFSKDPFQLVGLLYTIYLENVSRAEESAASFSHGRFHRDGSLPLTSPLEALSGDSDRSIVLSVPRLAVALLYDTEPFTGLNSWSILRPIIRVLSNYFIADWLDHSAIFLMLNRFKGVSTASLSESPFTSDVYKKNLRSFFESEDREQSLLTCRPCSWSLFFFADILRFKPKSLIVDYFKPGNQAKHFCLLLTEVFIYGAFISANVIELSKRSIFSIFNSIFSILRVLFLITLYPQTFSTESILKKLLRMSPRNFLRILLLGTSPLYSVKNWFDEIRTSSSTFNLSPAFENTSGIKVLLEWLLNAQRSGYASITSMFSWFVLGLPIQSRFVSNLILRLYTFGAGLLFKSSILTRLLLGITVGGCSLLALKKPWHWMDFNAILVINSLYWGWEPFHRMLADVPYCSNPKRLVDASLATWMTACTVSQIFVLWWFLPHMPLRLFRPFRLFFQYVSFYALDIIVPHLFRLLGGHFGSFCSLVGTGLVLFSISALQASLYRKIPFSSSWEGLKVSYAQGNAAKLFQNPNNTKLFSTDRDAFVIVNTCPGVQSYSFDQIAPVFGGKDIPQTMLYPSNSGEPGILDLIDMYFFGYSDETPNKNTA